MKFIKLLLLLIFVELILNLDAQEWSVPEGSDRTFLGGLCLHIDSMKASYMVGTYYSFASRAFEGYGNYEASKNFSEYRRQGLWLRTDYHLIDHFTLGMIIPYYTSSIKLSNNSNKTYFQRGISEIRLRMGYNNKWKGVNVYAGLSTGLPVQEGRQSMTSPEIPIGNDAYWNVGLEAGLSLTNEKGIGVMLHASIVARMAQSGYVVWSDTLSEILGISYSSIQATIDRRDYVTATAAMHIPWGAYQLLAGYTFYYEWPDYAHNLAPMQTPAIYAWVKQIMGADAYLHALSAGILTYWGPFQIGFLGKAYVIGKGAIAENSLSLMFRYTLKTPQ